MKYSVLTCLIFILSSSAGIREKLFIMEKSHNPENVMIIEVKLNEKCEFQTYEDGSLLNFYWLMDGGKYTKDIHPLIRHGIAKRVEYKDQAKTKTSFKVALNDLKEVQHDLPDSSLDVSASLDKGKCSVQSILELGPSKNNKKINLTRSFCKVETNVLGIPVGCTFLELEGKTLSSGKPLHAKFKAED
tara:strand:- start:30 stop:593 length:564 start_codon:yes stop_codon:yes gene_type:complete